jgi:hypothetical protein
LSNTEKIETRIFPRLNGFVKHMWDLPLAPEEDQGWQMYEGSIPELKKNLSFIIARMIDEKLDVDTRHVLMAMLTNALFHCPTGQKEGIETMLIALVTGVTQEALFDKIFLILAREKNMLFKVAIMPGDDGQNVHMISTYFDKLKDTLGLTAYFSAFKEKIGIMGNDPFGGSLGNALEAFYTKFNPDYLIKVIMDNIENKEEYTLRVNDEGEDLMNAKECLIESKKQRSIITDNFVGYLTKEKILPTKLKDGKPYLEGWEAYFKHDPMGEVYPEVKPEGIQMILIKMGVLKERAAL